MITTTKYDFLPELISRFFKSNFFFFIIGSHIVFM